MEAMLERPREAQERFGEVGGIKVYVHAIEPTRAQREAYDAWWRGVLGSRVAVVRERGQ